MQNDILERAIEWSQNSYFDAKDREELLGLLKDEKTNEKEILERFYQDLEFGTGGLRSILGFGRNRMNKYNVRKATQAMANIALEKFPNAPKACVSFDCRNFSKEFSQEVASVFAANGIKTYVFKDLTPTPMLSFAVRHLGASCGVMVTASHNPKQYNGYKAYWSDGAQVTPPEDQMVIDAYYKINDWSEIKSIDFNEGLKNGMIEYMPDSVNDTFYSIIEKESLNLELCQKEGSDLSIVFTSLHGTSLIPCSTMAKRMGFTNFHIVEEQASFDGNFSTVKSTPNPEDPIALEMAVEKLKNLNADVAFGTDPDCDRLGVVVNHQKEIHYLNGNQIAFLMLHYILTERSEKNLLPKNPLILKSIVTSELQTTIAEKFGATMMNTLTGFKWMAMKLKELEDKGSDYNFVFASEESFGYLPYGMVRDKDAVSAVALMSEIALYYKKQNKTLIDALNEIYEIYGYAQESLISLTFEGISGKQKIESIMNYYRENYQNAFKSEEVSVFKDYKMQVEKDLKNGTTTAIDMTKSNVLGFEFKSGNGLFLRPSGTEPKIKFYTMVKVSEGDLSSKKEKAKRMIKSIEDEIHAAIKNL